MSPGLLLLSPQCCSWAAPLLSIKSACQMVSRRASCHLIRRGPLPHPSRWSPCRRSSAHRHIEETGGMWGIWECQAISNTEFGSWASFPREVQMTSDPTPKGRLELLGYATRLELNWSRCQNKSFSHAHWEWRATYIYMYIYVGRVCIDPFHVSLVCGAVLSATALMSVAAAVEIRSITFAL